MPTILNSKMPLPSNWQEFESIVQDALKLRYNCVNFSKNGRVGQKQNGVDIFANVNGTKIGAQCKLTFNSISESVIDAEIINAKSFTPKLNNLDICTTSPRDAKIQNYVWNLKLDFSVNILFWDDITSELEKDINIFKLHFPYFNQELSPESLFVSEYRNIIDYIIQTDSCASPVLINVVTDLKFLLQKWIMPDLYSKNKDFRILQNNIINHLSEWLGFMTPKYMHNVWDGDALSFNVHPIEHLEEMRTAMKRIIQNIYNDFSSLIETNLV